MPLTREQEQGLSSQNCDAIIEIDKLGRITFVHYMTEEIAKLLGYAERELLGQQVTNFLLEAGTMAEVETLHNLYASEQSFRGMGRKVKTKNGQIINFESYMVPIYDADGRFIGHRGMEFLVEPFPLSIARKK